MGWLKKRLWPNKISVLVVCHANICRSPMAEGILKQLLSECGLDKTVRVDSAGTHAGPLSSRPDARAQRVCLARGIDISKLKSREIKPVDLQRFDYILVMDQKNLNALEALCPASSHKSVLKLLHYLPDAMLTDKIKGAEIADVPDPYYGNEAGFERVYELMSAALKEFVRCELLNRSES